MRKVILSLLIVVCLLSAGCVGYSPTNADTYLYEGVAVDCGLDFQTFKSQIFYNVGDSMVSWELEELERERGLYRFRYRVETTRKVEFLESLSKFEASPDTPSPVPIVTPDQPPEDRTWISPGKVNVGNFHLGARAEYSMVIHNGEDSWRTFQLSLYPHPSHVAEGYYKAPIDVIQNWVIIADDIPVLAPRETREILIALEMPSDVPKQQASFLQTTKVRWDYQAQIQKEFYDDYLAGFQEQYPNRPEVASAKAQEAFPEAWTSYIEDNPDFNLLVYLNNKGSLSWQLFHQDRAASDGTLAGEFIGKGYLIEGNLIEDNWEFWIDVKDISQTGEVQVSMATRWLIAMRGN